MQALMNCIMRIMNIPINLFGFDITLWNIFVFCALGILILRFVFGLFK